MGRHVRVAIIGSGFAGLGLACELARRGNDDFLVSSARAKSAVRGGTTPTPAVPATSVAGRYPAVRDGYPGTGTRPPVLLLHGSGPGFSAWANWRTVLPGLSTQQRVLAPDLVGFGYTDRPDGFEYRREHWVAQLLGFLDALELPTVSIIGISFGGALARWLTSTHPERVHRLVLMGATGVGFALTPGLDAVWGYQPSPEAMAEVMRYFAYDQSRITGDLVQLR